MRKLLAALVAAIGLLALAAGPSAAQEWPQRGALARDPSWLSEQWPVIWLSRHFGFFPKMSRIENRRRSHRGRGEHGLNMCP